MYSNLQLAKKYIRYICTSANGKGHGMHSPFVFDFILHVLNNKKDYETPSEISRLRGKLLRDRRWLEVVDLGAGSRLMKSRQRMVKDIARTSTKPRKYGAFFYRLVRHYKPATIIEMGTSLGVTTCYMAAAHPEANVVTIEGSQAIAAVAGENFRNLQLTNIEQHTGNFDSVLPDVLKKIMTVDLCYVDGNHLYSPTISYFHHLVEMVNEDSILVFDDIHWSAEMEQAWSEIKDHPSVKYTIDLFFLGVVFFKSEFKVKQHFVVRF